MARFSLRKRKAKTCSLSVPSHRLSPSAYCQRRPPLPYLWPSPTSFMSTGLAISGGILCLSRRMVKAVLYSSCFSPVRVAESNRFPVTESEKILDGLLGRGFGAKCKSLIKLTKSRIDVIRRKRNATQKFLKKDIADLLANGLDINAYVRLRDLQWR